MTFTYGNDPASSQSDQVRLRVGDTDPSAFILHDEEIVWLLTEYGSAKAAAAAAADLCAAWFIRQADELTRKVGDTEISRRYIDRAAALTALGARLRAEIRDGVPGIPWANPDALGAELAVGAMDGG